MSKSVSRSWGVFFVAPEGANLDKLPQVMSLQSVPVEAERLTFINVNNLSCVGLEKHLPGLFFISA